MGGGLVDGLHGPLRSVRFFIVACEVKWVSNWYPRLEPSPGIEKFFNAQASYRGGRTGSRQKRLAMSFIQLETDGDKVGKGEFGQRGSIGGRQLKQIPTYLRSDRHLVAEFFAFFKGVALGDDNLRKKTVRLESRRGEVELKDAPSRTCHSWTRCS